MDLREVHGQHQCLSHLYFPEESPDALPVSLIGMNADLMERYIEFVADRLIQALGYPKLYNASNPFDWMELISVQGQTNFFERRVGEYQKANVKTSTSNRNISFDVDF